MVGLVLYFFLDDFFFQPKIVDFQITKLITGEGFEYLFRIALHTLPLSRQNRFVVKIVSMDYLV
jgi:hypothetical protein